MIDIYNKSIENNNITYSIDKIRLKCYMTFDVYNDLDFFIRAFYSDKIKRFWISDKKQSFKYNYDFEVAEGKCFYFGFFHNSEQKMAERLEPKYNFTIEFNPNKLKDNSLIMHILNLSGAWYIVRYDLAMDIKINILDLIFDKSGKRKIMMFSNGYDDRTYTIGGSGEKHIKIYNKKKESDLHITGDLTRVEITRECNDFFVPDIKLFNYDAYFPELYLNQYVYSLSDYVEKKETDKTLYAMLFAVQNGYPLNDLSRRYKEKIKNLLQGGYKIRFDTNSANQALKQTIYFYFIKNKKLAFR